MKQLITYKKWFVGWLLLVHISGAIGMLVAPDFFLAFTPLNLLLSALLVFGVATNTRGMYWPVIAGSAVLAWLIEVVGVKTGLIFGEYSYGESLGPSAFGVPFLIGVNWSVLLVASQYVARQIRPDAGRWWSAGIVSMIMTSLDVLMEFVAPLLDFWSFSENGVEGAYPGMHNFLGWAITSFLLAAVSWSALRNRDNVMSVPYLLISSGFFLFLALFL